LLSGATYLYNRVSPDAGIAQTVEQRIRNAKVGGSIPLSGTIDSREKPSPQGWAFSFGVNLA
jgi:hypothetical protein